MATFPKTAFWPQGQQNPPFVAQPDGFASNFFVPAAAPGHEGSGHEGHDGHGGAKFPPFDPGSFAPQLVWLAICFGALYMLLSRVALPKIGGVLAERSDRIQRDLAEAERMKAETDAALKAYEQSLADARGKAQTIAKDTRDRIAAQLDSDRQKADHENAAKVADMEKQIAANKARALASVSDIAADAAGSIVAKLLGRDIPADEIRKALADRARG